MFNKDSGMCRRCHRSDFPLSHNSKPTNQKETNWIHSYILVEFPFNAESWWLYCVSVDFSLCPSHLVEHGMALCVLLFSCSLWWKPIFIQYFSIFNYHCILKILNSLLPAVKATFSTWRAWGLSHPLAAVIVGVCAVIGTCSCVCAAALQRCTLRLNQSKRML